MSVRVAVAPAVLEWAQERSGKSEHEVEDRFSRWTDWLAGRAAPTLRQVEGLAKFTRVPFGVFFLEAPPKIELQTPDFRLGLDGNLGTPSPELLDVMQASQRRQEWFREYALRNEFDAIELVGAGRAMSPREAAALTTSVFGFDVDQRPRTREAARNLVRNGFEIIGGLIVFAGIVGNNTSRKLNQDEFGGFTLADSHAPFIFINSNGTLSRQLFTFFHEFGHVLRAESGVCDGDEDIAPQTTLDTERWCNDLAAEVLVPTEDLRRQVGGLAVNAELLDRLSDRYLASTLVILIQLRNVGLLPPARFDAVYRAEMERVRRIREALPPVTGGEFWNNQPFRTGERLGRAVIAETRAGRTSYTEALALLGFRSAQHLATYAEKLGMR